MNIRLVFILALFLFGVSSCKEKAKPKTPPPAPPKVEVKKPVPPPAPVVEEVVEEIGQGVELEHSYFVIVNSYTVPEFANEKSKLWNENGFKSMVIMRNDDGYYRLALQSFNDYSTAVAACLELREQNTEFKDAWVMYRSKKIENYK
jgi:cell division protein FtsN